MMEIPTIPDWVLETRAQALAVAEHLAPMLEGIKAMPIPFPAFQLAVSMPDMATVAAAEALSRNILGGVGPATMMLPTVDSKALGDIVRSLSTIKGK